MFYYFLTFPVIVLPLWSNFPGLNEYSAFPKHLVMKFVSNLMILCNLIRSRPPHTTRPQWPRSRPGSSCPSPSPGGWWPGSPSPAPPQWVSSPRPENFKCLAFDGSSGDKCQQRAICKALASFLDSRWGASIYGGYPVHIIVRLILDTPGFFSFHFCKYLCTWSG